MTKTYCYLVESVQLTVIHVEQIEEAYNVTPKLPPHINNAKLIKLWVKRGGNVTSV